ncbi:MAG: hypothetical protein R3E79_34875 [Caldilineaceae bacterium]
MAKKVLVTELHALIQRYKAEGRPLALVLLIFTDPGKLDSKFTLIISAPSLDDYSRKEAIGEILNRLIEQNPTAYHSLDRITVIHSSDPFVQQLITSYTVNSGELLLNNEIVNGYTIPQAILVEAQPLAVFA